MISVTPIYLALTALLYVALTMRVVKGRMAAKAIYGDGEDADLRQRIRAHGNCSEYAPILILLLLCAELQGTPAWVLHIFGALILASRMGHAYWMSQVPEPVGKRQITMATTFGLLIFLAFGNLAHALF
ncbi:MAPEG family protein [Litoreibacter roseus]|uniref:Glutathione S-transferase n=1 Tax=Litoreibacter roseus TaxID=2601869 RepID=A0A6N6JBT6_9RHOB|nr:MAPEG family protein [Litoreibacter roseus]GFE63534.1 hypothetical protein KIN_06080 [Litoreibacter roseus]